jgi:hypothetical protein
MRFLEVIDLHHDGQPELARRLGTPAFVHQSCKVLVCKPCEDGINSRPGYPQHPADADLIPPLIVQPDYSQPGLGTVGMGMVVPPLRPLLPGDGARLPNRLDRFVINRLPKFDEQDARQLTIVKPLVEGSVAIFI